MLAVGIDTSGLTHVGSVVAAQALLQLNGAFMIDILTTGGDPDLAITCAPLHRERPLLEVCLSVLCLRRCLTLC